LQKYRYHGNAQQELLEFSHTHISGKANSQKNSSLLYSGNRGLISAKKMIERYASVGVKKSSSLPSTTFNSRNEKSLELIKQLKPNVKKDQKCKSSLCKSALVSFVSFVSSLSFPFLSIISKTADAKPENPQFVKIIIASRKVVSSLLSSKTITISNGIK